MTVYQRIACGVSLSCLAFGSLASAASAQQAHVMQGRIWDFSSAHPDMQTNRGGQIIKGQVAPNLGPDGKPLWAGAPNAVFSSPEAFNQWYRDVSGVNMSKPYALELTESPSGSGRYGFNGPNFFPIDNQLLGNEGDKFRDGKGQPRNFHYTMQLAGEFSFRNDDDAFTFTGDDDLWVFFGGKLGIDLGGVHSTESATITGAQLRKLGLEPRKSYPIDIFFAERQTDGSNFSIQTSFNIQPPAPERVPEGAVTASAQLAPGDKAERNREYPSPNGEHFMIFQEDGNFVVYRAADRRFVWGLNLVQGLKLGAISHVMMSQEGDLVAVDSQWSTLWSAPTENPAPGSSALITDGGAVEVRRPDGTLAWASDGRKPEAVSARGRVMQGRIWDFSSAHPDFETGKGGSVMRGQVALRLGADGKPVWAGSANEVFSSAAAFSQWYRDAPGVNMSTPYQIQLTESPADSGRYVFERLGFFPIDDELLGNEGGRFTDMQNQSRNFHFTMQLAGEFSFRNDDDAFTFTGDDDLWVFFGGKLGIDLGGVHRSETVTITGAQLRELGLSPNESYAIDIFFAERQSRGSNFVIQTNFDIRPPEAARIPQGEAVVVATLAPGQEVERNREYLSANGAYFLIFQDDGNLVIYRAADRRFVWGLNLVQGLNLSAISTVRMSAEGDLLALDGAQKALWSAQGGASSSGSYALATNEGALEIRRADGTLAWASDGRASEAAASSGSRGAFGLKSGETMRRGEFYGAGDNLFVLPENGNLSIYAADAKTFKWGLNQIRGVSLDQIAQVRSIDGASFEALDGGGRRLWLCSIILEGGRLTLRDAQGAILWEDGGEVGGFAIEGRPQFKMPNLLRMAAYSIHDEQRTDANEADLWFVNLDGDKGNLTQGAAQALRTLSLGEGKVAFIAASGPHAGDFLIAYDDHAAFEKEMSASAVFHVRAPLEQTEGGFASFESAAFPGQYLRHQGFRLKLDAASSSSESLLRRDATFRLTAVE